MDKVYIEEFSKPNEDGFVRAILSFKNHGGAIEVIGSSLDECVSRAVTIREAFNSIKGK